MILVPSRPVGVAGSTPHPLSANNESGNDLRLTIGCLLAVAPGASAETPHFMGGCCTNPRRAPWVRSKLLRVGSETGHRIRQATPVRVDAVAPSPSDAHLSECAAAFPRRLYATASMESDSGLRP